MVLCFKWSVKKPSVAKILWRIWERFLYENNPNYNSYKFSDKFTFIPVLSFSRSQKQEPNFQQVGDLVTRNIFVFCLKRVALYFKGMPNSIDFYKEGFLTRYSCSYYNSMLWCYYYYSSMLLFKYFLILYQIFKWKALILGTVLYIKAIADGTARLRKIIDILEERNDVCCVSMCVVYSMYWCK